MKILIAGGAGFIGSTIAMLCSDEGHEVIILDNLITGRREFTKGYQFYEGDIGDGNLVDRIFSEHPDIYATINCAARIIVPDSVTQPLDYYENNISHGLAFIRSLLRNKCYRYLFSGTGSVYDLVPDFQVSEDAPLNPLSPYSRTKMYFEGALKDICAATPLAAIVLRYFNPIGADPQLRCGLAIREPSHALGKLINADETGSAFILTGVDWPTRDGSGIRDYVHVWDLARAHLRALERFDDIVADSSYEIINLGTGTGTTVRELIEAYQQVTGAQLTVIEDAARPGDFPGSFASGDKAKKLLDWVPQYNLEQGIKDTLAWFNIRQSILDYS